MAEIKQGDIVQFTPNGLYYRCENTRQARWMNENASYILVPRDTVAASYFEKTNHKHSKETGSGEYNPDNPLTHRRAAIMKIIKGILCILITPRWYNPGWWVFFILSAILVGIAGFFSGIFEMISDNANFYQQHKNSSYNIKKKKLGMKISKAQQQTTPIFELGPVPCIPHCIIHERKYEHEQWIYYILNNYNSYASGWGTEDFIINQISKNEK